MFKHLPVVGYAALLLACSTTLAAESDQNYFYDSEAQSAPSLISEFLQKICSPGFNGYGTSLKVKCNNGVCEAKLDITQSIPKGDVYLTRDFSLLFSRENLSKQSANDATTESRTLKSGMTLNVEKRYVPLVDDKGALDSLNNCFHKVGKLLKDRLQEEPESRLDEASIADAKLPINITERVPDIGFGQLEVAFQKAIDIREDGIVRVEFTPTQRFIFSEPKVETEFLRKIERQLASPKLISKAMNAGITGSRSFESSEYVGRTLIPTHGRHKSLVVQLEGADTEVTPLTPTRQTLTPLVANRWLWKAKFTDKFDSATLRLKVAAPDLDANSAPLYFRAFDIKLVKPWDYRIKMFFSNYWQWIIVTFVLPFVINIWRQRKAAMKKPVHVPFRKRLRR